MEHTELEAICKALTNGPAVLLLGQDVLKRYAGSDAFLTASASRFGRLDSTTYAELLELLTDEPADRVASILHNISMRIAVPEALQEVAELPWNAVLTSCFHEVVERALATDWRTIDSILSDQRTPSDPRNRTRLHVLKLFGCVTSDRDTEQPPLNELDLLQRKAIASSMLGRLPELVTPRGILVIDAVAIEDWLDLDKLGEHLASLGKNQAHFFNATPDLERVKNLSLLARMGKLRFHRTPLLDVIQQGKSHGFLSLEEQNRTWVEGVQLTLRSGQKHVFSPADWRRLTAGVPVLCDADVEEPVDFASADEKYRAFREFQYGFRSTPNWRGLCHGFAFRRPEFKTLANAVRKALQSARIQEEPIHVCGQSGVGKTVALADLAVEMRREGWPVLYFGHNYTDLDYGFIETVCTQLERIENTSTLLIWDSMAECHSYSALASHMASRGRKIVVVGSIYEHKKDDRSFEFLASMEASEVSLFLSHLRGIDPKLVEGVQPRDLIGNNFFALLWRLLPETRGPLRTGLLREFELHEQKLDDAWASRSQTGVVSEGLLGTLLREAGFAGEQTDATEDLSARSATGTDASKVERLSGLILIPARYGQDIPVDLVLRCLGKEGFDILRAALQNVPVYRWTEDDQGNQLLGARQRLEADVIVRARFKSNEEFDFIRVLVENVRLIDDWQTPNPEVDFVERLLRAVGPDSEIRNPTPDDLILLADAIATLMENNANRPNPRMLFQEGHLRREALLRLKGSLTWDNPAEITTQVQRLVSQYEKASQALSKAEATQSGKQGGQRNKRAMSFLHTEFASLYGLAQELQFLITEKYPNTEPQRLMLHALQQGFDEAVRHCKFASVYDSENAYPADVRFRVTRMRLANDATISNDQRVTLVTDLCDVLESECWRHQPEVFERRRLELADTLGDATLRQEALSSLGKMGSMAGEYFVAWNNLYFADHTWRPVMEIQDALRGIESLGDRARRDLRLTRLYTRAWWHVYGNPNLFSQDSERVTAGLSREQWEHFGEWLRQRLSFQDEASIHARFQYAWTLWQTGRYRESDDAFRELDRELVSGRLRVVRLAVWSDAEGHPMQCQGVVRRVASDADKAWVYVPSIRREIAFQPADFRDQVIRPDEQLRDFYIAFNFRGPIADPSRYHRREGRNA